MEQSSRDVVLRRITTFCSPLRGFMRRTRYRVLPSRVSWLEQTVFDCQVIEQYRQLNKNKAIKFVEHLRVFRFKKKSLPNRCEAIVLLIGLQQSVPAARHGYQPVSASMIFRESHWEKPCDSFIDAVVQQWKTSFKWKLRGRPRFFVMCMMPCSGSLAWVRLTS